jgi:hypothetical protein
VSLPGVASSSVGSVAAERKPTSFTILRAALLGLVGQGQASLRLERRFCWSIPREGWYAPATHEARVELLPRRGAGGDLPWVEQRLLSTLWALETHQVDAGREDPDAADLGSPYRHAPQAERTPQARWVGVPELLCAFFKAERAQLFHHRWLLDRVAEGGGEATDPGPGWAQLPVSHRELWALLSPSTLRRTVFARRSS